MNPLPAARGVMNEAEYDSAREKIKATYGDSRQQAGARWEQELASLFYHSGWPQERLAKKEGKSQPWIVTRLRFGRFLAFCENITVVINLTERRFRSYWDRTDKSETNERVRFREVEKLLQEELTFQRPRRTKIGHAIKDKFADGKWHGVATIANRVEAEPDQVEATLEGMRDGTYGVTCERRKSGRTFEYRIFPNQRTISSVELTTKLTPLVEALKAEGKKNMATMSPITVAYLAGKLEQLLDEWTE